MSFKVRITQKGAQSKLRRVRKRLKQVPQRAHKHFVNETPIDTGNAKRRTKLISGNTIDANYPYAVRLDEGHSKQAVLGMSLPTFLYIRKLVRRIFILG
jgi:hypothetical protein